MATEPRYNARFTLEEKQAVESLLSSAIDAKAGFDPVEYKVIYNAWTRVCNAKPDTTPRRGRVQHRSYPNIKGLRR